jgi:hypothetical protein
MAALDVKISLCLGKYAVPLLVETLGFVDPYDLAGDADEEAEVSLVNFNVTGDKTWLNCALEKEGKWWVYHAHQVPLLMEVLTLIMNKKVKKGSEVLMPRKHKNLCPLQVRGKVLWFMNNSRCVTLALKKGHEVEQFKWFMQELKKDTESLANGEPESIKKLSKAEVLGDIHSVVEKALQTLRDHPGCDKANYLPSKNTFRLVRVDDSRMDVRVKKLKRKRAEALEHDGQEGVSREFDMALQACFAFLEQRGPQQPDPAVPVDAAHAEVLAEGLAVEAAEDLP